MPFSVRFLLFFGACLLVTGCGKKGPLYLRDSPPPGVKAAKPKSYEPVPYPRELTEEEEKK
jgi:predicted small lipoprotein YifL